MHHLKSRHSQKLVKGKGQSTDFEREDDEAVEMTDMRGKKKDKKKSRKRERENSMPRVAELASSPDER